tara:strand:+ start:1936 stop:2571 length:636 start_codon:yes stop_codon:yes gene_type:complete
MIKDSIDEIKNDLRSKRDALMMAHQKLNEDSNSWNQAIIALSLTTGLIESIKMKLELNTAGWALVPIILSSITAACSSLIKFRNFSQRQEILIQASANLTSVLNKARNHKSLDDELLTEYNLALEKLETSIYPTERKVFLRQSHKNLLEILKQETKYFNLINLANAGEVIELSDEGSLSSEEQLDNTTHPKKEPLTIIQEATTEEELINTL